MKSPTFFACGLLTSFALLNSVCGPALAAPALIAPRADFVAAARGPIVLPATPARRSVRDLGRAQQTLPVRIALTLRYQHEAELQRLIDMQSDRRSHYYHRFLSNRQFADYFAPLPAQEAAVVATSSRAGFAVTNRYANRTIVDAVAPAATAERYFSTEIHRFAQPAHGMRYATVKPALIPAELTGTVATVSGLNNIVHLEPQFVFARPAQKAAALARAVKLADGLGARLVGTRVAGWRRLLTAAHPQITGNTLADPGFKSGQFGAPDFVAVGGTSLFTNVDGSYQSESGWTGSTGGISTVWAIPPYQTGFAGISGKTRHVPDLPFAADPATGTSLYVGGSWQGPIGGTSWSSPIFCTLQTEIDQRNNSRFGFVNPAIYNAFSRRRLPLVQRHRRWHER